jgi:hypothetical protein
MGKLIRLDQPTDALDDWIVPGNLARYDQRYKPWPNELFPYDLQISDYYIQGTPKVLIRRCIEQDCRGDVAMEHVYSPTTLAWLLWFQFENDRDLVSNYATKLIAELQQKEE